VYVRRYLFLSVAGSERLTTAAGDTTGLETRAINLSLTSLANVISALTSPGPQHVPYRDSKLTRLLKVIANRGSK
jgi:hypothetical protein